MSTRFYLNWPLAPGPIEMTGPEARHLATVCRFRAGDRLCLFNGDGHEYPATVVHIAKHAVRLDIESQKEVSRELPYRLSIAAPIPKGDRAQFLIEKLTELGVTAYIPLLCARAVVEPGEGKIEKLRRYVIEASKQCGRNVLMEIMTPREWTDITRQSEPDSLRVLAHPIGRERPLDWPRTLAPKCVCAVGPEGGFTDDELGNALSCGWHMADLGPRILRIETAALVLATIIGTHRAGQ